MAFLSALKVFGNIRKKGISAVQGCYKLIQAFKFNKITGTEFEVFENHEINPVNKERKSDTVNLLPGLVSARKENRLLTTINILNGWLAQLSRIGKVPELQFSDEYNKITNGKQYIPSGLLASLYNYDFPNTKANSIIPNRVNGKINLKIANSKTKFKNKRNSNCRTYCTTFQRNYHVTKDRIGRAKDKCPKIRRKSRVCSALDKMSARDEEFRAIRAQTEGTCNPKIVNKLPKAESCKRITIPGCELPQTEYCDVPPVRFVNERIEPPYKCYTELKGPDPVHIPTECSLCPKTLVLCKKKKRPVCPNA